MPEGISPGLHQLDWLELDTKLVAQLILLCGATSAELQPTVLPDCPVFICRYGALHFFFDAALLLV